MARLTTLTAAALVATAAVGAAGGTAFAKPIERQHFHDELSFVISGFCGVAGLDISVEAVTDGVLNIRSKGRDQVPYFTERLRGTTIFTNPDNDHFVTESFNVIEKDLRVTDNGDGTSTILVLATGNSTVSGMDGKAIARNPGQLRYEILIDNGGTPQDPSDDEFLEFLGDVKGSTGRTDDFCAAALSALA